MQTLRSYGDHFKLYNKQKCQIDHFLLETLPFDTTCKFVKLTADGNTNRQFLPILRYCCLSLS